MKTTVEVIGPKEAAKYLERNVSNRPLRKRAVQVYGEVMQRGGWKFTPEAIYFDEQGNLLNGQHRLHAVIASGTTQRFTVVRGVDRDLFAVIDGGVKRSDSDRLHDAGVPDSTTMSVALKYLILYKRCPEIRWAGGGHGVINKLVTAEEMMKVAYEIGDEALSAASLIGRRARAREVKLNGHSAATAYLLMLEVDKNGERLEAFWHGVLTGEGLAASDPRLILRNWALGTVGKGNYRGQYALLAILKAWNAYIRGQQIRKIRWADGEAMPQIASPSESEASVAR